MGLAVLIGVGGGVLILVCSAALLYRMLHPQRKTYGHALALGLLTSPDELGMTYREQRFRFPDGSTTLGWVIEGRCPDGPVVVMTHGWESSVYNSLIRVPMFARWASELVLYDMRGHGESTAKACHLGASEPDDLHAVIEQAGNPDLPVVLFGSSMGAGISLVAASPTVYGSSRSADRRDTWERIVGVICEAPYRRGMEPIYGHFRQQGWPSYPVVPVAYLYLVLRFLRLWRFDRVEYAQELRRPLLVLHGTNDPISQYGSGRQIADAAERGRLVSFEGGTHGDLAEVDPQRYTEAIDCFFRDLQAYTEHPPDLAHRRSGA